MKMRTQRSGRPSGARSAMALVLAAGSVGALVSPAAAGPQGETVVYGDVTFVRNGDVWTVYVGDLAIIQYSSFDIAPHEIVQFIQPGANSRVLNRILSGAPTRIDGQLLGNGQIYLVNPSGVIFGKDSVVNAGALYAAAGNISNRNFLAGVNRFTTSGGAVENYGTLSGDLVALVGSTVANHGNIRAHEGTVVMAAGEKVMIGERFGSLYVKVDGPSGAIEGGPSLSGPNLAAGDVYALAAWNTGTIAARNVHVESTGGTLVSGSIDATGRHGGSVAVLGDAVELRGASVDASGRLGGGSVVIGGDGKKARSAEYTVIDAASELRADALHKGDGGSVIVWSEAETVIDGALTARGGAVKGDGGFIETSSVGRLSISRGVDASAANGDGGLWYIDPTNIVIAPGGSAADYTQDTTVLGVDLINDALSMGMGVFIDSNSFAAGAGNITQLVSAPIIKTGGGGATLTLRATGDITLFGGVFDLSGNGLSLNLLAGTMPAVGPQLPGTINLFSSLDLGTGKLYAEATTLKFFGLDAMSNPASIKARSVDLLGRGPGGSIAVASDITTTGVIEGTGLGVRMDAARVGVGGRLTTHNGGGVRMIAPTSLVLTPDARLDLDGAFTHAGGGQVLLGADITTTGDDVTFSGPVTLLGDVRIRTFDGVSAATPSITFAQGIDSFTIGGPYAGAHFLSLDAGNGTVFVGGDIGSGGVLEALRFRGRTVTVHNTRTLYQQQYIADTAVFRGSLMETTETSHPTGFESAQVEVLGDALAVLGFAGNTRLENNLTIRTAGSPTNNLGVGDGVFFAGTVESAAGAYHDLTIDAGEGLVVFGGDVGASAGSNRRLGTLEVLDGVGTELFGSVFARDGMSFWTPVEVNAADTVIHTGDGVAWFGQDIYSARDAYNNVTFAFDGLPWIDFGSARTPFKFAGNVGTDGALTTGLEFGTVRLGTDLGPVPLSATFLFGDGVLPGDALTPLAGSDLGRTARVWARDAIIAGRGQKLTSFGSLELVADNGVGGTLVQFGDVNVLGDFTARAVDGEIRLRLRDASGVEFTGTEADRFNGVPVELMEDIGAEVIAMGSITLESADFTVNGGGSSSSSFLFASDSGGMLGNGSAVLVFDGGVGPGNFLSGFLGDVLYPYDLAILPGGFPDPSLGLALRARDQFNPRYPDRYLPEPEVLEELGLNPRDVPAEVRLAALGGGEMIEINDYYIDDGSVPAREAGTASQVLTLDRLSRPAVTRLTEAYVALLGERVGQDSHERQRSAEVQRTLAQAWATYGGGDPEGFRASVNANDPAAAAVLAQAEAVFEAFERLELPEHQKAEARARLIEVVRPASISAAEFGALMASAAPARVAMR